MVYDVRQVFSLHNNYSKLKTYWIMLVASQEIGIILILCGNTYNIDRFIYWNQIQELWLLDVSGIHFINISYGIYEFCSSIKRTKFCPQLLQDMEKIIYQKHLVKEKQRYIKKVFLRTVTNYSNLGHHQSTQKS